MHKPTDSFFSNQRARSGSNPSLAYRRTDWKPFEIVPVPMGITIKPLELDSDLNTMYLCCIPLIFSYLFRNLLNDQIQLDHALPSIRSINSSRDLESWLENTLLFL